MSDSSAVAPGAPVRSAGDLRALFDRVRRATEVLCEPLEIEDYVVQTMTDASPTKWHLAHTSWFFETFVLEPGRPEYRPFHPEFRVLFNSYYNTVGPQHDRPQRGLLARPTVREIFDYRAHVDAAMRSFMQGSDPSAVARLAPVIELGCHHEQQHQELILTDLKHVFAANPLRPAYRPPDDAGLAAAAATAPARGPETAGHDPGPLRWISFEGGLREIGREAPQSESSFCFDNETPRHSVFQVPFRLADRLVTNREYQEFLEAGGYERPELWLSEGWDVLRREGWTAPLYWWKGDGGWTTLTLSGVRALAPGEPVCHISYYEADAYARWRGARLPTEQEWEIAAAAEPVTGNFVESRRFHPAPDRSHGATPATSAPGGLRQLFGDVWEWTRSPYAPYPGYAPTEGALGEYNGKFMCSQMVLRGGSCVTPASHIRATYRNFFYPGARWQFSGLRLAQDQEARGGTPGAASAIVA